jgi:single-strand DNA-binding protein
MPNVNKAIVMGVLGRDPKTKNFPNGGSITTNILGGENFKKTLFNGFLT